METCMFVCFHVTFGVQITIKHHVSMCLLHVMLTFPPNGKRSIKEFKGRIIRETGGVDKRGSTI